MDLRGLFEAGSSSGSSEGGREAGVVVVAVDVIEGVVEEVDRTEGVIELEVEEGVDDFLTKLSFP